MEDKHIDMTAYCGDTTITSDKENGSVSLDVFKCTLTSMQAGDIWRKSVEYSRLQKSNSKTLDSWNKGKLGWPNLFLFSKIAVHHFFEDLVN